MRVAARGPLSPVQVGRHIAMHTHVTIQISRLREPVKINKKFLTKHKIEQRYNIAGPKSIYIHCDLIINYATLFRHFVLFKVINNMACILFISYYLFNTFINGYLRASKS